MTQRPTPPPAPGPPDPAGSQPAPRVISLDDFLKTHALVVSGGHAKLLIQSGGVKVNGDVETRRRRKLLLGDIVELLDQQIIVQDSDLTR